MGTTSNLRVELHLTGGAERIVQPSTTSASDIERSGSDSLAEAPIEKFRGRHERCITDNVLEEEVRCRPDLPMVIKEKAASAASTRETVGIFVCGPLEMQGDVLNAVA